MGEEMAAFPLLTKDIVRDIFDSSAPYSNDDEKETCQRMVDELTSEEQDIAACTSYAYWYASTFFEGDDKPSDEICVRMAMREARRQLVGSSNDETVAMDRLREFCKFREEYKLDLLRTCYLTEGLKEIETTPEEEEIKAKYRAYIEEELNDRQQFFVRGHDRESRAVAIKMGRVSPETTHEAYEITQLYIGERAMACTEFLSLGAQEKVVIVMDFEGYSSSNAPPILTLKDSISLMQGKFPERLKTAVVTEPAFWMRALYNVIYPLMSNDTADKIQMAYGEAKYDTISAIIAPEQAMTFMMPGAQLETPFDAETFLRKVPFHCIYDAKC